MAGYDFIDKVEDANKRIGGKMEHMLGSGLMQPLNNCEAGARKIMAYSHKTAVLPLLQGEKAVWETGYEQAFSIHSSSIRTPEQGFTNNDIDPNRFQMISNFTKNYHELVMPEDPNVVPVSDNYRVAGKVSKFSFSPNHHYYLLLADEQNKILDVVERISYHAITESYGYLYNNTTMDNLQVGEMIPRGTILRKSLAFDEHMNRTDGVNFNVAYMSLDKNMEDSIIFSDVAAKKLTSPLIKPVEIMINENDIPLNLYGNDKIYKAIPDIGEDIKDSVLIGLRKEKREESVYTQSAERLRHTMMSDVKYTLTGKVIDIDIMCNNVDFLNTNYYNSQFKMYYDELQRMSSELVSLVTNYEVNGYKLTYALQKVFANAKRVLNKDQYIGKKLFSNIVLQVVVLEERDIQVGDKTSNRYGGKGVISSILPQALMPRFNGNEHVDVILNSNGVYGRENPGQLFELSVTHIGCEILNRIKRGEYASMDEAFKDIITYISFISKEQANSLSTMLSHFSNEEKSFYLNSILMDGAIHLSAEPISEAIDIDTLAEMYKTFPWVHQVNIEVPMRDSNGDIRYVPARRPIVVGKQFTFRLKQYAEEKFSATSLSATNIRNENTKSKAARDYRELYSNTPIRFGNMETNDMNHLGAGYVITNLMIHSISPHARLLTEQMFTEDPYHIDIRLDDESTNRSAEIANTYLKTIGRRLIFTKRKKVRYKILQNPMYSVKPLHTVPLYKVSDPNFDFDKDWEERQELEKKKAKDKNIKPVFSKYAAIDTERRIQQFNDEVDQRYRDHLKAMKKEERKKYYNK